MGCGAGPRPRLSLGHQTRTHRIELCITQGLPQVRLVQRAGIVPTLPDMTTRAMDGIPIRSIPAVGVLQRQTQDVCFRRNGNEMHMVGHQAVADQSQVVLLDVLPQQIEIDCAVGIAVEDLLSGVATLRYVMG